MARHVEGPRSRRPRQHVEGHESRSSELRFEPGAGEARSLRVVHVYRTTPDRLFSAWLDARFTGTWLFATATQPVARVEIDARVGGGFRFVERRDARALEYAGEYVEIVRPRRLVFTLVLPCAAPATRVEVTIDTDRDGSRLTLVHAGVPASRAAYVENRWIGVLYGLGERLGIGVDGPIDAGIEWPA